MLLLRNDVEATVLRLPGQLYQHKDNGVLSNVFTYKLINKTTKDITDLHFKLRKFQGNIKLVSTKDFFVVPAQGLAEGTMFIEIPQHLIKGDKTKLMIEVYSGEDLIETTNVNFLGPRSYN